MSIISVPNDGSELIFFSLYCDVNESENLINIKILDIEEEGAWECKLTMEDVEANSKRLKISTEEYWKKISEEIQSPSGSYQYTMQGDKFSVKKIIPGEKGKGFISFCNLDAEKAPLDATKNFFIDTALKKITELQKMNLELVSTDSKLRKERDAFNAKLDELAADKLEFEDSIQEKVVGFLNSKKEKIRELTDALATAKEQAKQSDNKDDEDGEGEYSGDTEPDSDTEMKEDDGGGPSGGKGILGL